MKLTKRKGFNFYRSYYDVYNELNDKDKLLFMDALLDRQFLGKKPDNLKGMVSFAYISQTNSIDAQVKGYETKTNTVLCDSSELKGATVGGSVAPSVQEKEKGEEKGKEKDKLFTSFWNLFANKKGLKKSKEKFMKLDIETMNKILLSVPKYLQSDAVKKGFQKNPETWINGECWNDEVEVKSKGIDYSQIINQNVI